MKQFLLSKKFSPLTMISVVLLVVAIVFTATYLPLIGDNSDDNKNLPLAELYARAVADAMHADIDELHDLVTLTKEDSLTSWQEDKVLLVSWHKYPDSYKEGEVATLTYGNLWTFTIDEIDLFYSKNSSKIEDWTLRLEQLIGLPQGNKKTHFSGFWVDLDEVIRPATEVDVTKKRITHELALMDNVFINMENTAPYGDWYNKNILDSYYSQWLYPWTRLGYTYDWGRTDDGEYGLTEFLIKQGAEVEVAFTKDTSAFIEYLRVTDFA